MDQMTRERTTDFGHPLIMSSRVVGTPVFNRSGERLGHVDDTVGEARAQAIALARDIAAFPQACLRADRLSALRQWDLAEEDAIASEMRSGLEVIASGETLSGATRFASGVGRHGAFGNEAGTAGDRSG